MGALDWTPGKSYETGDIVLSPSGELVRVNQSYVAGNFYSAGKHTAVIKSYKAPDTQVFAVSGTWTKPAGAKRVEVYCISGGAGGGSGRRGAAGSVRCGGGGGAGGGTSAISLRASDLPVTVSVTVGAGGTGGVAVTTDNTDGNPGTNGHASSFGIYCKNALDCNAGAGGTATGGAGGAQGLNAGGIGPSMKGADASTTGGAGTTGNGQGASSTGFQWAGPGGGSGGGITSADVANNGGVGGNCAYTNNSGGAAGVVGGALPTTINMGFVTVGGGGGGGAASITGPAQSGANGSNYGGGGGGGGASLNGNASGAGGNGGSGAVIVTTYFGDPVIDGSWVGWGDSLTAGSGGGGTTYPNVLAGLLGKTVVGQGIGGETSTQIAARAGGHSIVITQQVTVPASGSVTVVTSPSVPSAQQTGSLYGVLNGIRGYLTYSAGTISFTRQEISSSSTVVPAGSVFVHDLVDPYAYYNQIIWVGRNNYQYPDAVVSDVNRIISVGKTDKFIVLGVLNGNYPTEYYGGKDWQTIVSLNNRLASIYGDHFIDIRSYIIKNGLSDASITPTAQDLTDISNDITPSSIRADNVHLIGAGYTVVANQINNKIAALGF